jgi:hypothetical protein
VSAVRVTSRQHQKSRVSLFRVGRLYFSKLCEYNFAATKIFYFVTSGLSPSVEHFDRLGAHYSVGYSFAA